MSDARQILNDFTNGLGAVSKETPAGVQSFMNFLDTNCGEGALSVKTKELIGIAIGVYNRCKYCITFHTYKAFEAGATREEILEAAMVSATFGAGPTMAYISTYLMNAINEFEHDFDK